jgi:hypothetical protein
LPHSASLAAAPLMSRATTIATLRCHLQYALMTSATIAGCGDGRKAEGAMKSTLQAAANDDDIRNQIYEQPRLCLVTRSITMPSSKQ